MKEVKEEHMRYTLEEYQGIITRINPNLHIISNYLPSANERKTPVKMHCDVCGADYDTTRGALSSFVCYNSKKIRKRKFVGCPVCDGKKIIKGINDIGTLYPDIAKFYVNKNYTETHTLYTDEPGLAKCPYCGMEKMLIPYLIQHAKGFPCDICKDGLSYPNKFSRYLLKHLPVENFIPEYRPSWAKPYSYDNYFEYQGKKFIVEMDGNVGHGNMTYKSLVKDADGLKRDKIKEKLAQDHDITVIRIDCKESSCDYIKESIYASKLSDMFDLSKINWTECDLSCRNNLFIEVCEMYKANCEDYFVVRKICERFGLGQTTVRRYLKRGEETGLLTLVLHTSKGFNFVNSAKTVYVYDLENNPIGIFKHSHEAEVELNKIFGEGTYKARTIRGVASGKQNHKYKQLLFFDEKQQEIKDEYKAC